jgi:uncharacterized protein YjbI with pentapeptide repeats
VVTFVKLTIKRIEHSQLLLANLSRADLSSTTLVLANLLGADLYEANLLGADLYEANLTGAKLSCAKFAAGANLVAANLRKRTSTVQILAARFFIRRSL